MDRAGFPIKSRVRVVVDPKLKFMGYTADNVGGHRVVVSGNAVRDRMVEGLLLHELSHVYRTDTKHPSHDKALILRVTRDVAGKHGFDGQYQLDFLHQSINHIQDLYADDVSIKASLGGAKPVLTRERTAAFFLGWVSDRPAKGTNPVQTGWIQAGQFLRNMFALANMERHNIPDRGGKARNRNKRFLSKLPAPVADWSGYFRHFMARLPNETTSKGFEGLLTEYLENSLAVVGRLGGF